MILVVPNSHSISKLGGVVVFITFSVLSLPESEEANKSGIPVAASETVMSMVTVLSVVK